MIVAIAPQGSGKVLVIDFREAVDVATAVADYCNAFTPPKNPADFQGYDTGWSSYQYNDPGKYWAYDVDAASLVQIPIPVIEEGTVRTKPYQKPDNVLFYYGYPNSYNYSVNAWDNEKVAQDMAKHNMVVLGNNLATKFASGSHTGPDNQATLTDSTQSWTVDEHVGKVVRNLTDGSKGTITANTATTITAVLAGGTDNDWDTGDDYDVRHQDYENTIVIINRMEELRPDIKIWGYVATTETFDDFKPKVDEWCNIGVYGIFVDSAGYDYGTPATNGRDAFNEKIDYVHTKASGGIVFANAWNMDHILGTENDPTYPNSTWNPSLHESSLGNNDWILLESFPINTTDWAEGYEGKAEWLSRGEDAMAKRETYGVNLAAVGIINNGNANGQDMFDFGFISSMMWNISAFGTSDTGYGAGSSEVDFWTRPSVDGLGCLWCLDPSVQEDGNDADVYWRLVEFGKLMLDFSTSTQDSSITTW